jgi:hypothetical protein
MATISPTIIVNSTPGIEVTMVGAITYPEFINTLGIYVYKVYRIILEALSIRQINQPITYHIYNPNGTAFQQQLKPRVDPYQRQATYVLPTGTKEIILNGFSSLAFLIRSGETVTMELCSDERSVLDELDKISKSNFQRVDDKLNLLKLYRSQQGECKK